MILGSSIGDFAAVILLSLLFSTDTADTGTRVTLLVGFAVAVAVITLALSRRSASMRIGGVLLRLQDTTAQIRVRGSMLLLIVLVVVAERFGLETILGAFVAGVLVGFLDRDGERTHPLFHVKLDAIGYGFLVPIFFVTSGLAFDLDALLQQPTTLLKVPLFLAALLLVRAVPAVAYRSTVGGRGAAAAGLLQATSLPFIVAATQIGVVIGAVTAATAAAFIAAGLVSALVFPVIASGLLRQALVGLQSLAHRHRRVDDVAEALVEREHIACSWPAPAGSPSGTRRAGEPRPRPRASAPVRDRRRVAPGSTAR